MCDQLIFPVMLVLVFGSHPEDASQFYCFRREVNAILKELELKPTLRDSYTQVRSVSVSVWYWTTVEGSA